MIQYNASQNLMGMQITCVFAEDKTPYSVGLECGLRFWISNKLQSKAVLLVQRPHFKQQEPI